MWEFLAALVLGLLKWVVAEGQKPDTAEEGIGPGALEKRLTAQLKKEGRL
jgi:hypothetical protein